MNLRAKTVLALTSFLFMGTVLAQTSSGPYLENQGLVVMEMENTESNLGKWVKKNSISPSTGSGYLEFTGNKPTTGSPNSPLEFNFKINKSGLYYLHLHCAKEHLTIDGEHRTDVANDAYVRVDGDYGEGPNVGDSHGDDAPLSTLKKNTKFFGGSNKKFTWASGNKLDLGGHTNKRVAIYDFKAGETYKLVVHGRSQYFKVNRIVFRHKSVASSTAQNLALSESQRETVNEPTPSSDGDGSVNIAGELKQWHRVDLKQSAKYSSEMATPNPFSDYRFNVEFTAPSGSKYLVPGYFATDGNGADEGNVWMAHLNPSETGTWSYKISFRSGTDLAVNLNTNAGTAISPFNGKTGTFTIAASDKTGDDFRAANKGMLINRGEHYLTYGGSGKPFLYTGPGIPENILGYRGFTNTTIGIGHNFDSHLSDWNTGDPDFNNGNGKKLIGALNYIANEGANSLYMMSNTIGGDGKDVFPYPTSNTTKDRYDLLKLKQWDIALAHAQAKGIFLHWHLAEHENPNSTYYGGQGSNNKNITNTMTVERKLSFRMLNAVFGHYNGLKWNIMEETEFAFSDRTAQMEYIKAIDPYDHPVTFQVGGAGIGDSNYTGHLGQIDGIDSGSFQGSNSRDDMFDTMQYWRRKSSEAGVPWTVAWDEPQPIENDNSDQVRGYPQGRRDKMWPCLMAGADGFMWYIQKDGGGHGFDQRIEDFTIMNNAFNWSGYLRTFLGDLPLKEMQSSMNIVDSSTGEDYTLYKDGAVYAVYNDRSGKGMSLNLSGYSGTFEVKWFDPRNGGSLLDGTIKTISGGGNRNLGSAPYNTNSDWAVLVKNLGPVDPGSGPGPGPEPEPEPEPNPDGSLLIIEDAYLQNGSRVNNAGLRVEGAASRERISYLKFSVIDAAKIETATLKLTVKGDNSDGGIIRVFAGSHSNWTEDNLSKSNAPSKGSLLAKDDAIKAYPEGSSHEFDITALMTSDGAKTLIIDMIAGGDDVMFSSKEGSAKPVISITLKPEPQLPTGQSASDVGNVESKMLVAHENGTYLASASGRDIWGKADSFGFVHQDASGDVEVTAKIESLANTNQWAKAGVMVRESFDAGSKHAMTVITPEKGASFQRRTTTDANSRHTGFAGIEAPEYVRVLRMGNKFTGYYSADNNVWFPMDTISINMYEDVKVGLALTSHDNGQDTEAMISNFTVNSPADNSAVTRFILVNADTDEDIREIHHNETINLNTDGIHLSIRAETTKTEGSVVIDLDGTKQTENIAPYTLKGDKNGDYASWSPAVGTYTIMATPFSEPKGVGAAGDSLAIVINVVNN